MKKTIAAIVIILILVIVGYLAWVYLWPYFSAPGPSPTPTRTPLPTDSSNAKLKLLSSHPVFDYWIDRLGAVYYFSEDGQLWKIDAGGGEKNVISQNINDLNALTSSHEGQYAVVSFGPAFDPDFSLLNVKEAAWQPLPDGTSAAAFDPLGNRLAYLKNSGFTTTLNLLNLSDKKTTEILRFSQRGLGLEWALPEEIYLTQKPSHQAQSSVWAVNLKNKTLKTLIDGEFGLMVNWSVDGQAGLKFTNFLKENDLSLIDKTGQILQQLSLLKTLPVKCAFETLIYCALPGEIPSAARLPDDYLKRKIYFKDAIVSFNPETGALETLFKAGEPALDAERLKASDNKLIFINRYDRKLYSISL